MPTRVQCRVKGCKGLIEIEGACAHHHRRFLKNGVWDDLWAMTFHERLWSWIDVRDPAECWPWLMKSQVDGYGVLALSKSRKTILAHRAVWEDVHGPIPHSDDYHGTVVLHQCDNPKCCNPWHLRLGSQAENVKDMDVKGRRKSLNLHGESHGRSIMTEAGVREIRSGALTDEQAAEKYGMDASSIKQIRLGRIWKHVDAAPRKKVRDYPKGSANAESKLTEDLVRDLRAGRKTTKEVVALTGATKEAVNSAKRGATWKHVA